MEAGLLPEAFVERCRLIYPEKTVHAVLESFTKSKPVTFRANTLKTTTEDLIKTLQSDSLEFQPVDWYKDAFMLDPKHTKEELTATAAYKSGALYIQNLSSMIPALILDPQPEEYICDLTAAPGSKTAHMAMLMKNTGTIIANDISRNRMFRLKANLKEQGVSNVQSIIMPGQRIWKRYTGRFDKTLVDVPCTMEGRFFTGDADSYKDWTPKKVKILSQLQKFLLRSAVSATKPGGLIVYSTCTLEPLENEDAINWLLEREEGNVNLEAMTLHVPGKMQGLTQWKKKTYDSSLTKTMRVVPSETMEGFYIAALRKKDFTIS